LFLFSHPLLHWQGFLESYLPLQQLLASGQRWASCSEVLAATVLFVPILRVRPAVGGALACPPVGVRGVATVMVTRGLTLSGPRRDVPRFDDRSMFVDRLKEHVCFVDCDVHEAVLPLPTAIPSWIILRRNATTAASDEVVETSHPGLQVKLLRVAVGTHIKVNAMLSVQLCKPTFEILRWEVRYKDLPINAI